jgi:hypothetical protein
MQFHVSFLSEADEMHTRKGRHPSRSFLVAHDFDIRIFFLEKIVETEANLIPLTC